MSRQDRLDWDTTYRGYDTAVGGPGLPGAFAAHAAQFPTAGTALDLACGQGRGAVWLAGRGLDVVGVDVSGVAIAQATALAKHYGVAGCCRFEVVDLDDGLPPGPPVDAILCHRFRDHALYGAMFDRLAPGGVLAISVLSEVGGPPGRYRAAPGELAAAFSELDVIASGERGGEAWLLARRPMTATAS
ncbi:class I SAM-dependent methyltransferase [Mycobacterium sp. NPDC003449]